MDKEKNSYRLPDTAFSLLALSIDKALVQEEWGLGRFLFQYLLIQQFAVK
jgi:hypothetical protein